MSIRKPIIVAGPCSAESAGQVLRTARELDEKVRPDYFRAGIWKPRTHPGGFEGVGQKGLEWLRLVQREIPGQKVCTEALGADQARACIDAGIDMIWLGARTTSSPYLVQQIASVLEGTSIPVFVKNPISPDIDLWAGAVERLLCAGIRDIVLVHRGFIPLEKGLYRNDPHWGAIAKIRSRFPSLPLITDPSHIAGKADLVGKVASQAFSLGSDGLMVETHCEPDKALSDAAQQITPSVLADILAQIRLREKGDGEFEGRVEELRAKIDSLDERIVSALAQRMQASREIGLLKERSNVSILQSSRWSSVLESVLKQAEAEGIDKEFVRDIYERIHARSLEEQTPEG